MPDGTPVTHSSTDDTDDGERTTMCHHVPTCPDARDPHATAAHTVSDHDVDQGWQLLCNGLIVFHDGGCLVPP
ncbi:DUF5999 family protein [Nocardioides bruguierae]|uniref:DUF5999 family protein n=1 Tax=Nocardioides bruguierae TaxID=2945102 RepID=A0A9X2D5U3_9ACTN|nr:DUF5999 family protein [Nocardioides bruguierae]MCM0619871.1 DUF5999 family protein [Nocardioides bruguierae]